jgi:hypothetical protein
MSVHPARRPDLLGTAARAMWPNLPGLAMAGVLVCAALVPAVIVSAGLTPLAVLLTALVAGPVWAAAVDFGDRTARGDQVGVGYLVTAVRHRAGLGVRVALPPAVCAACTMVTLALWQQTRAPWLLAPLGVGGAATLLTVVATVAAFPVAIRTALRGRDLWLTSLAVVVAAPLRVLAVLCALVVSVYVLGFSVSASLLLLLPGPLAVLVCVAVPPAAPSPLPTDAERPLP